MKGAAHEKCLFLDWLRNSEEILPHESHRGDEGEQGMDNNEVAQPPPANPFLHDVISSLADEGVPVRVIARATKTPGENTYEVLKKAMIEGRIIQLPTDDWAPGSRKLRVPSTTPILQMNEDVLFLACSTIFKLTRLQSAVFLALIRRPEVTKEQLHIAIENNRPQATEQTDRKIVDVVICHIRKKVKDLGIVVDTIWGRGYSMQTVYRDRVAALFMAHFTEEVHGDLPLLLAAPQAKLQPPQVEEVEDDVAAA